MHEVLPETSSLANVQEFVKHLLNLLQTTFVARRKVSTKLQNNSPSGSKRDAKSKECCISPITLAMHLVSSAAAFYQECNMPEEQRMCFKEENDRIVTGVPHDARSYNDKQIKNVQVLILRAVMAVCYAVSDPDVDMEKIAQGIDIGSLTKTVTQIVANGGLCPDDDVPDDSSDPAGITPHVEVSKSHEASEIQLHPRVQFTYDILKLTFNTVASSVDVTVIDVSQITSIVILLQEFDRCSGYEIMEKVVVRIIDTLSKDQEENLSPWTPVTQKMVGVKSDTSQLSADTLLTTRKRNHPKSQIEWTLKPLFKSYEELCKLAKQLKTDYLHSIECRRRSHRHCDLSTLPHQHHDIMGLEISKYQASGIDTPTMTPTKKSSSRWGFGRTSSPKIKNKKKFKTRENLAEVHSSCIIGRAVHFLVLNALPLSVQCARLVMTTLDKIGICHCVQPNTFVLPLLSSLMEFTPSQQDVALATLDRALLQRMNAISKERKQSMQKTENSCNMLLSYELPSDFPLLTSNRFSKSPETTSTNEFGKVTKKKSVKSTNSTPPSIPKFEKILMENRQLTWLCLACYRDLILPESQHRKETLGLPDGKNVFLPLKVANHLASVAVHFDNVALRDVFTTVMLPILRYATEDISMKSILEADLAQDGQSIKEKDGKDSNGNMNDDIHKNIKTKLHPQIVLNCLEILRYSLDKKSEFRKVFVRHSGIEPLTKLLSLNTTENVELGDENEETEKNDYTKRISDLAASCLAALLRKETILSSDMKVLVLQDVADDVQTASAKNSPSFKRKNLDHNELGPENSAGKFTSLMKGIVRSPKSQRKLSPFRSKSPDRHAVENSANRLSWSEQSVDEIKLFHTHINQFLSTVICILGNITKSPDSVDSESDDGFSDADENVKMTPYPAASSNSTGYQSKSRGSSTLSIKLDTEAELYSLPFDPDKISLPADDFTKMQDLYKFCLLISSIIQDNLEVQEEFFKLDGSEFFLRILTLVTASLIQSEGILDVTLLSSETSSIKSLLQSVEEQTKSKVKIEDSASSKSTVKSVDTEKFPMTDTKSDSLKVPKGNEKEVSFTQDDSFNDVDDEIQEQLNKMLDLKMNLLSSTLSVALLNSKCNSESDVTTDDIISMLKPLLQRSSLMITKHCQPLCKSLFEAAVKSVLPEISGASIAATMLSLKHQIFSPKRHSSPTASFNRYSLSFLPADPPKRMQDSEDSDNSSWDKDDSSSVYNMMTDINCALESEADLDSSNDGYQGDSESEELENSILTFMGHSDQTQNTSGLLAKDCAVVNPELIALMIQLLGDAGARLESITNTNTGSSTSFPFTFMTYQEHLEHIRSVIGTTSSLITYCRSNFDKVLNDCDLPLACLESFQTILQDNSESEKDIRQIILELCLMLNKERMSAEHLRLLLSLFNSTNPPMDQLLKYLLMLVHHQRPGPSHHLAFPTTGPQIKISEPTANEIEQKQDAEEVYTLSVWKIAPLRMPIAGKVNWPTSSVGITISLWLQVGSSDVTETKKSKAVDSWESGQVVVIDIDHSGRNQIVLNQSTDVAPYHHLVSIGTKQTMLQIWLEGGTLIFRICVDPDDDKPVGVLAQTECTGLVLTNGEWQHITFTYSENHLPDKTILGKVHVIANCTNERDVILEHNMPKGNKSGSSQRRSTTTPQEDTLNLFVGHWIRPITSQLYLDDMPGYKLGTLMVFDDIHFNVRSAFSIFRRGPSINNLTECLFNDPDSRIDSKSSASVSSRIRLSQPTGVNSTPSPMSPTPGLECGLKHQFFLLPHSFLISDLAAEEFFIDGNLPNSKNLQEHLVMSYSPDDPSIYLFNPNKEKPKEADRRSRSFSFFSSSSTTSNSSPAESFDPLTLQCVKMQVKRRIKVKSQWNRGLHRSLNQVGGVQVFLMLCAKVVEVTSSSITLSSSLVEMKKAERIQSLALEALLELRATDSKRQEEFASLNVAAMLHKLLTKPQSIVGFQTLQIVFNAACSGDDVIINVSDEDHVEDCFEVNMENSAILHDQELLQVFLTDWNVWHKAVDLKDYNDPDDRFPVWSLLLEALLSLVKVNHPHQWFNSKSLMRAGIIHRMLTGLQQMITDEVKPFPGPSVTSKMMELIRALIGSPPNITILSKISDFLVATHPPASTFVCHNSSSYYFNLHRGKSARGSKSPQRSRSPTTLPSNGPPPLSRSASVPIKMNSTIRLFEEFLKKASKVTKKDTEIIEELADESQAEMESSKENLCSIAEESSPDTEIKSTSASFDKESESQYLPNLPLRSESAIANSSGSSWEDIPHNPNPIIASPITPKYNLSRGHSKQEENIDEESDELNETVRSKPSSSSGRSSVKRCSQSTIDTKDEIAFVISELLNLLFMAVMTMQDIDAFELTAGPLCAKTLIVGVHHKSSSVRTATLRMLAAYFSRCSEKAQEDFLREKGFHLVANQIHQHTATRPIIDACLYFLLGHPASSAEVLPLDGTAPDPGMLPTPSPDPFSNHAVVLLLAALANTTHDAVLCKDVVTRLQELFECMGPIADVMLDNGLTLALCNLITKILSPSCKLKDAAKKDVLEELQHFMSCIAVKACVTAGSAHFQVFEDLFTLLHIVEYDQTRISTDESLHSAETIRTLSLHILMMVMELMQKSSGGKSPMVPRKYQNQGQSQINMHASPFSSRPGHSRKPSSGLFYTPGEMVDRGDVPGSPDYENAEYRSSLKKNVSQVQKAAMHRRSVSSTSTTTPGPSTSNFRSHGGSLRTRSYKGSQRRRINEAETARRLQRVIIIAVDKLIHTDGTANSKKRNDSVGSAPATSKDDVFVEETVNFEARLFNTLMNWLEITLSANTWSGGRRSSARFNQANLAVPPASSQVWGRILNISKDSIQDQVMRLFVHYMSPWRSDLQVRMLPLSVVQKQNAERILSVLFPKDSKSSKMVSVYLHDLISRFKHRMTAEEKKTMKQFCKLFHRCGGKVYPMPQTSNGAVATDQKTATALKTLKESKDATDSEIEKLQLQFKVERERSIKLWHEQIESAFDQLRLRTDHLSSVVSQHAMDVTQQVVLRQNKERKKMVTHMKDVISNELNVRKQWVGLLEQLAHERAVWYDEKTYPKSWQLDATEGPNRERRRLQRCHLNIEEKFLMKKSESAKLEELKRKSDLKEKMLNMVNGHDKNTENEGKPPAKSVYMLKKRPLSFLFDDGSHSSDSVTIRTRLQTNERICVVQNCINVTASSETPGEVLVGESCMYFVGDEKICDLSLAQALFGECEVLVLSWRHEEVAEVHKRWWQLQDIAIEIFLTNGKTYLLAFKTAKERDIIVKKLKDLGLPNLVVYDSSLDTLTQIWRNGGMTNFEYLTQLNKAAGRSFNDLMQYPVMPFVLADYTSAILDLNNVETFRNLLRPISVPDDTRMKHYQDRYRILAEDFKNCPDDERELRTEPFHYGSHYSNSGTVLHFLVRLPPYTQMFLEYQDASFDIPDRTFHSMETTFRLSCYSSTTDVKELVPEFFFLPEFLCNLEGFDFGFRQCGLRVNHVTLPPWSKTDPRLFILIHRQALESDYVSANLHGWIDLVFGFKQTGKAAIEAVNVFHPATYFGMDVSSVEDPVKRKALETMIKTYGQTPKQLFTSSHPAKNIKSEMKDQVPQGMANNGSRRSSLVPPGKATPQKQHSVVNHDTNRLSQIAERKLNGPKIVPPQRPLSSVLGLKWGKYLGSPSSPDPVPFLMKTLSENVGSLVSLLTNDVCALAPKMGLLVIYNRERSVRAYKTLDIKWSAVLTYGHPDNIVRLKMRKSLPDINLFRTPADDKVTCSTVGPDCRVIVLGHRSGAIVVNQCNPLAEKSFDLEFQRNMTLYGHYAEITCLVTCGEFRILASGSKDGTVILWDLDALTYVRSLTGHATAVCAMAISRTSGDVCTVCDSGNDEGSHIRLWTINGSLLAARDTKHRVQCVAFSSAPEGISVNVVAAGLANGVVRLWSSWDLTLIREIEAVGVQGAITCVAYTHHSEVLYAATNDKKLIGWCFKDKLDEKHPILISFLNANEKS